MKKINNEIDQYFEKVIDTLKSLDREFISRFVDLLLDIYRNEGTIFVFANGGSASTASHFLRRYS